MMSPEFPDRILREIRSLWDLAVDAEITIEANPGTLDTAKYAEFFQIGINRLSIGAQSFHNSELQTLGRIHSVDEIYRTVDVARKSGFDNISLDLIYGIPGQTIESLTESVRCVVDLGVEHLSTYSLSIEKNTPFEMMADMCHLKLPEQDLVADEFAVICAEMRNAGFEHYELTNFARPDKWSRHNRIYWRREPYLGIGTGAHSFDGTNRFWNPPDTDDYLSSLTENEDPSNESEKLTESQIIEETVYLSMRTDDGLDKDYAYANCDDDTLTELLRTGTLVLKNDRFYVDEKHWLLLDEIVTRLLQYLPMEST